MARDLTIILPDRPGALVSAWSKLRDAGVNIDGACGFPQRGETWLIMHVLVEDGSSARQAIESAGFQVSGERDVNVHELEDRPGALAELFETYLERSKNIDLMYMAASNRVVVGTDDSHEERSGYTTLGEKRT